MWTVYMHTNKLNGKKYIGITSKDPKVRWKNGHGYSEHLPIGRAIKKYGWDGFEHEILCTTDSGSEAKLLEKELIKRWSTIDELYGYNLTLGGDGICGYKFSEETKIKISESAKSLKRFGEKNPNYGNTWSVEQRERAAEAHKRENLSAETLRKMSDAAQGRCGENNPFYGKKHTEETKEILAQLRRRPVLMLDIDRTPIAEFESIKDAAECMSINKVAISNCCRGVTQTSGGYIWEYKRTTIQK